MDEGTKAHGEALLQRLRRLVMRARIAGSVDRRRLIALLDDLATARNDLMRECAGIEDEMRRSTARTTAIGAYLRGSQASRSRRQN